MIGSLANQIARFGLSNHYHLFAFIYVKAYYDLILTIIKIETLVRELDDFWRRVR